jgi:hypothetical protein
MSALGIPYFHIFIGFTAFVMFACALVYAWHRKIEASEVDDD